jgi:hypothetical protein
MNKSTDTSKLCPLLVGILNIQNPSQCDATKAITIEYILSIVPKEYFVEEDREGNLLFDNRKPKQRKGFVPTIVAHLDQVHDYARGFHLALLGDDKIVAYDRDGRRVGTGGDDKCGIYVALKMLMHSKIPCRVILTQDEEVGCLGARAVPAKWGDMSSILLQADRRGNNDLISSTNGNTIASDELVERVLELPECKGMKEEYGSVTDVGDLCEDFGVAGFNISAGYHHAHMSREHIMLSELNQCYERVLAIANLIGGERQEFPEQTYSYKSYDYGGNSKYGGTLAKAYTPEERQRWWTEGGWKDDDFDDDDLPPKKPAYISTEVYPPAPQITTGKKYVTVSGDTVGPLRFDHDLGAFVEIIPSKDGLPPDEWDCWTPDGLSYTTPNNNLRL